MSESQPNQNPPGATAGRADTEAARPRDLTEGEQAMTTQVHADVPTFPSLLPPGIAAGVSAVGAGTTWQSDARVTALWSINQNRNVWMYTWNHSKNSNIGWVKLSTASESGCVALNMLASSAKLTQTRLDYRQENDGMVHEIYLW